MKTINDESDEKVFCGEGKEKSLARFLRNFLKGTLKELRDDSGTHKDVQGATLMDLCLNSRMFRGISSRHRND